MRWRMPAEWAPHRALWIGFPWNPVEWPGTLAEAQADIAAFARAIADTGDGEEVRLVVNDAASAAKARALAGEAVQLVMHPIGDIWLRDTGPLIVSNGDSLLACDFAFNGWGGKYDMPGDQAIAGRLAADEALPTRSFTYVLEGGAIDVDGEGLGVTTEQCLLNPNRNPGLTRAEHESQLAEALGIDQLLWLGEGLTGDHTDGHVDNLARFVAPGRLAIPEATAPDDPNAAIYADAAGRATAFGLDVVRLPSPGLVRRDGQVLAASYMNFLIANRVVVMPTYGVANDEAAVAAIGALFPERRAIGVDARGVITGGGSFHCASQQLPTP